MALKKKKKRKLAEKANKGSQQNNDAERMPQSRVDELFPSLKAKEEKTNDDNSSEDNSWYMLSDGQSEGPFTDEDMIDFIDAGVVKKSTKVRKNNGEWAYAFKTELIYCFNEIENGIDSNQMSDYSVMKIKSDYNQKDIPFIILAFVPLLNMFAPYISIFFVLIINIILICMDISHVREDYGLDDWWIYMGLIFVPIYMFFRVANTTKKYWPAITWVVLAILTSLINVYRG